MEGTGHHLRLLGPTRFTAPDGTPVDLAPGKPLALLLYLHLAEGPVSREDLGTLLWPETTRDRARGSVRHALWLLRRTLHDDLFLGEDPVEVAPGALTSDVEAFRRCLVTDDLERARELWEGPPFQDFRIPDAPEWTRWTEELRRELEERHAAALSARGRREWERGRPRKPSPGSGRRPPSSPTAFSTTWTWRRPSWISGGSRRWARPSRRRGGTATPRPISGRWRRWRTVSRRCSGRAPAPRPEDPLRFAFVGRTEEFAALLQQWRQARGGTTRVGLLTGIRGSERPAWPRRWGWWSPPREGGRSM
jgi:hypothetical protein